MNVAVKDLRLLDSITFVSGKGGFPSLAFFDAPAFASRAEHDYPNDHMFFLSLSNSRVSWWDLFAWRKDHHTGTEGREQRTSALHYLDTLCFYCLLGVLH